MYLPSEREMMYTTPIRTTITSEKTVSSSSAPLITKNRIRIGVVHLSARSISSSETSQILQNTVPSIMQASSDENPICTEPIWNLIDDRATVIITKVTETAILLEREWKYLSHRVKSNPITNPRAKESTTSRRGSRITDEALIEPAPSDLAIPKEIAKTTSPTASSNATTGSKISVKGPFALYCFTTIKVAAGAVAVATAPRTIAD